MTKSSVMSGKFAEIKMRKSLLKFVGSFDPKNEGIDFDTLGNIMNKAGLYKILYNPNFHVSCHPNGKLVLNDKSLKFNNKRFSTRKKQELEFQMTVWNIFNNNDKIEANFLCEFMLSLSKSKSEDRETIIRNLKELIKVNDSVNYEEIIKLYTSLNPGPLFIDIRENQSMLSSGQQSVFGFRYTIPTEAVQYCQHSLPLIL